MAGVYVSFPFCAQKCTYCNFASGVFPRELEVRYLLALGEEIGRHKWSWTPETVYLGGGTPSRLSADDLAQLLAQVPGRPWREATIEAAPGDLTPERAKAWHGAGINRVSFGVQSFVERELAQTGRRHSAETVSREVEMLRSAAISNISIDLIAGLPHQTCTSFSSSLDWIERLDIPHVSTYMLEVDEDSRLGLEILSEGSRYGVPQVPPESDVVSMYSLAIQRLQELGLARYEISNFAKPGFESLHNLKYWQLQPYIGFGADAHSFDGQFRSQNVESAATYVSRCESGQSPIEELADADLAEERLMVGLRLSSGITLNSHDRERHQSAIDRFIDQGLLTQNGDMLRLTDQGVLYSNEVFQEFVTV